MISIEEIEDKELKKILVEGESISVVSKLNLFSWNIRREQLHKAYKVALLAEEISLRIGDELGYAQSLKSQGYCLWRFSDFHASMEKSTKALEVVEKFNLPKEEADILNSIGAVYMFLNDNKNRLYCNLKCLELRRKVADHEGIAGSLNNIGETYMEMQNYEEAIKYFNDCLEYPNASSQIKGWNYHNLGIIEMKKGNYKEAELLFVTSIRQSTIAKDKTLTCETLYNQSINLGHLNQNSAKEKNLFLALELANEIGAKDDIQKIHLELSKLYEQQNNIGKSFEHFKIHTRIHNQVYNEKNSSTIHNLKSKYELNSIKKEAEIQRLKNVELKKAFEEIEFQKNIIENNNKSINDSIRYAEKIQTALLTSDEQWEAISSNHFILFKPRDIVSGDFYWAYHPTNELAIWVVADCTGHGVPGAFMSMLGVGFLNEIVVENAVYEPNEILNQLRNKIIKALSQKRMDVQQQDGMDLGVCVWDKKTNILRYSGAYNTLYVISDKEKDFPKTNLLTNDSYNLYEITGDRQPVGSHRKDKIPFSQKQIQLCKEDAIYMYSDGYIDQFGGKIEQKFMKKQFKELLLSIQQKTMLEQKKILDKTMTEWMMEGKCVQIDDICVVGVKVE